MPGIMCKSRRVPDGSDGFFALKGQAHVLLKGARIPRKALLGGLYHEYDLEKSAS